MNLDHCRDPMEEVRNWIAIAARKMKESGISPALIFSVSVSSDGENVFYKDDFPATPEGDKLLSESTQMTTEQHNYLNIFWVSNAYLNAVGTDEEAAYRKEFEKRAAQAERNEYADVVRSSSSRNNAKGKRPNALKELYAGEYQNLVSAGKKPTHKAIMNRLEQHDDVIIAGTCIGVKGAKGGKTVSFDSCKKWLTGLNEKS